MAIYEQSFDSWFLGIRNVKKISKVILFLSMCGAVALADSNPPRHFDGTEKFQLYYGTSDASAAVSIGNDMFVMADDENNILRVYKNIGGLPEFSCDLSVFLNVEPEFPEADIEGATMIGDRIYWITSHGRNKDGKMRPNRYRFFATKVKIENGNVAIEPVGKSCKTLVHRLVRTQIGRQLGLDKATRFNEIVYPKKEREKLAPKEQGLNIEGLCASPDGKILYIGLRNPLIYDKVTQQRKAVVLPLNNPAAVIEKGDIPVFGEPMLWNLIGLGIRDMAYSHFHKAYFIIAGPSDEGPGLAVFCWSGEKENPPALVRKISNSDFTPEALIPFKNSSRLLLLSDDGMLPIKVKNPSECMEGELLADGTCPNKFLTNPNKKTFRGLWLEP